MSRSNTIKFLIPLIFSACAIGISIYAECHNISQDEKYDELVYLQDATTERPLLTLLDPLDKLRWEFVVNSVDFPENDSIPVIKFDVTLKGNLTIMNKGKSAAHLRAISVIDSFTASPILRRAMLDEEEREKMHIKDWREKEFFYKRTILSDAKDSIYFEKKIRYFSQDSMMVVHIILLYEDDMKALFDTYYWVRIHAGKIDIKPKLGLYKNMIFASFKFAVSDLVNPIQDNTDYYVYRLDERNGIFAWWKEVEKTLRKKSKVGKQ